MVATCTWAVWKLIVVEITSIEVDLKNMLLKHNATRIYWFQACLSKIRNEAGNRTTCMWFYVNFTISLEIYLQFGFGCTMKLAFLGFKLTVHIDEMRPKVLSAGDRVVDCIPKCLCPAGGPQKKV